MTVVADWLEGLGLSQYAPTFDDDDIEFGLLPRLSDAQLKELGVESIGHRMKILAAAQQLYQRSLLMTCLCPAPAADGSDLCGIVEEAVPGLAGGIDDVIVGGKDPV